MKLDVFKPILELTLQESHRDSLLSGSCQEFFEHMRRVKSISSLFYTQAHFTPAGEHKRPHWLLYDSSWRHRP